MLQDDSKVLLHKAHGPRWIVGRVKFTRENFSRLASRLGRGTQLGGNLIYGKCLQQEKRQKKQTLFTAASKNVTHRGHRMIRQQKGHSQRALLDQSVKM